MKPRQVCSPRRYAGWCCRELIARWKSDLLKSPSTSRVPFRLGKVDKEFLKSHRTWMAGMFGCYVGSLIEADFEVEFVRFVPQWAKVGVRPNRPNSV